jgi:predicted dehydrogenase
MKGAIMFKTLITIAVILSAAVCLAYCRQANAKFTGEPNEVKLINLDPGHFHASLVQKTMYEQVSPTVYVYAPEGSDVRDYLNQIDKFNAREKDPTHWNEINYTGPDFLQKMIQEKHGNVVVISGNNAKKADYICESVEAGLNVLADKPMVTEPEQFPLLVKAFDTAKQKGVLLYDIMTERHEITTILQKKLANSPEVFGQLQKGTRENPAVTKESVHHFFKYVAGNPIKRPAWFFDTKQQGEGLVDVTTHLVDLVQWECFPEQIINYKNDIEMIEAKRWATPITPAQFKEVTQMDKFPDYLEKYAADGNLNVYSNGEMTYIIKGICAKVSVVWKYRAPEGAGDTHYSIMRGSKCNLIIRQGKEEGYKPILYIEADKNQDSSKLETEINNTLRKEYPDITIQSISPGKWQVNIPDKYRVGHEAHFAQVTQQFLKFLVNGMPDWEVPNMIAKYYTTTQALKKAKE